MISLNPRNAVESEDFQSLSACQSYQFTTLYLHVEMLTNRRGGVRNWPHILDVSVRTWLMRTEP